MANETKGKIKVKIPETSNLWEPKNPGDRLIGKYCKRERQDYRGRENYLYHVRSQEHPSSDEDGIVAFFGTAVLNDKLGKLKPGYDVDIVYQGEKPSPDAKRKPKKLFDIEVYLDPDDPILKKLYPDGLPEEILSQIDHLENDPISTTKADHGKESPSLNTYDLTEIGVFIDGVEAELKGKGIPLVELRMLSEAKEQAGDDQEFFKLVKKEILERNYPAKE